MNAARATGACASVLLHASLLLALFVVGVQPASMSVPAIPVEQSGDIDMHLVPDQVGAGNGLACASSYRGIGVVVGMAGALSEVVPGGPADRAGALVGDVLLNESVFVRDGYSVGRELPLRLERDGRRMDLSVRVGKVCYETTSHSIPHLREAP